MLKLPEIQASSFILNTKTVECFKTVPKLNSTTKKGFWEEVQKHFGVAYESY